MSFYLVRDRNVYNSVLSIVSNILIKVCTITLKYKYQADLKTNNSSII